MDLIVAATVLLGALPAASAQDVLTVAGIQNLQNNTLFTKWRPQSHFLSPHSWMNDPCGAVYDPAEDIYHLHYQFHPNHVNWGNISWGHAVSKDLFHWTDIRSWQDDSSVSLAAQRYDSAPIAVFTGTTQPVNLEGQIDGTLLTFATGIHALPTNWKIPYIPGTEVQALWTSSDRGDSWDEVGTVLPGPPEGWNVTGWRDPSFFPNAELDQLLGQAEPHFYMVVGSGLKSSNVPAVLPGAARPGFLGPRMPLYSAPASDLTQWTFLGALWEPTPNSSLGEPDVTGSYGYNWELSGFFDLPLPGDEGNGKAWFVTMGSEGGNTTLHLREQWALWNRGDIKARENGSVEFAPGSGGAVDWGLSYAQATFLDGRTERENRRLMWGWANEDIQDEWNLYVSRAMGYQGAMTLPAELFVMETTGLQDGSGTKDGNHWIDNGEGSFTAQTLGIRPPKDVLDLVRQGCESIDLEIGSVSKPTQAHTDLSDSFELTATLVSSSSSAGIVLAHSPGGEEYTTLFYDAENYTIGVERLHSSLSPAFRNYTHQGYFRPYVLAEGKVEKLHFRVVYDRSLLEVWVNDRFALTSRIYPTRDDSKGLSFYGGAASAVSGADLAGSEKRRVRRVTAEGKKCPAKAEWKDVKVCKGLAKAWPERPEDSSVQLLWDSAEETNNYTWWAGY